MGHLLVFKLVFIFHILNSLNIIGIETTDRYIYLLTLLFLICTQHCYLLFVARYMSCVFITRTTVITMWWMLLWKPCTNYCSHHLLNFYQSCFPPKGWPGAASRLLRGRRNSPRGHSVSVLSSVIAPNFLAFALCNWEVLDSNVGPSDQLSWLRFCGLPQYHYANAWIVH
jgi:hypothetical protein